MTTSPDSVLKDLFASTLHRKKEKVPCDRLTLKGFSYLLSCVKLYLLFKAAQNVPPALVCGRPGVALPGFTPASVVSL